MGHKHVPADILTADLIRAKKATDPRPLSLGGVFTFLLVPGRGGLGEIADASRSCRAVADGQARYPQAFASLIMCLTPERRAPLEGFR